MTDASIMGAFDDWDAKELCWICDAPRNGRLNTCCDEHEALFDESMQGPSVAREVIPTTKEARARVAEVLTGRVGPSPVTSGDAYAHYLDPVRVAYESALDRVDKVVAGTPVPDEEPRPEPVQGLVPLEDGNRRLIFKNGSWVIVETVDRVTQLEEWLAIEVARRKGRDAKNARIRQNYRNRVRGLRRKVSVLEKTIERLEYDLKSLRQGPDPFDS